MKTIDASALANARTVPARAWAGLAGYLRPVHSGPLAVFWQPQSVLLGLKATRGLRDVLTAMGLITVMLTSPILEDVTPIQVFFNSNCVAVGVHGAAGRLLVGRHAAGHLTKHCQHGLPATAHQRRWIYSSIMW